MSCLLDIQVVFQAGNIDCFSSFAVSWYQYIAVTLLLPFCVAVPLVLLRIAQPRPVGALPERGLKKIIARRLRSDYRANRWYFQSVFMLR